MSAVRNQEFEQTILAYLDNNRLYSQFMPEEKKQEIAKGQHPKIAVLCCADSRVAPENIFNVHELGEIFTVRVAGAVATKAAMQSLAYAVHHLGATGVFVIGHQHCGAVKATLQGSDAIPNISKHIHVKKEENQDLDDVIIAHMAATVMKIQDDPRFKGIPVAGGYYSLETGQVDWVKG
jgi:carbonic anhydrase